MIYLNLPIASLLPLSPIFFPPILLSNLLLGYGYLARHLSNFDTWKNFLFLLSLSLSFFFFSLNYFRGNWETCFFFPSLSSFSIQKSIGWQRVEDAYTHKFQVGDQVFSNFSSTRLDFYYILDPVKSRLERSVTRSNWNHDSHEVSKLKELSLSLSRFVSSFFVELVRRFEKARGGKRSVLEHQLHPVVVSLIKPP